MSAKCEVCCEPFNKSTRSQITCQFCPFKACSECSERYLCDTTEDAHCMACRKGWSREILVNNFSQKFVTKKYKRRREDLLFEREKSMMPATQPYVELEKKVRQLSAAIAAAQAQAHKYTIEINKIESQPLGPLAVANNMVTEFDALILRHSLGAAQRKIQNGIFCDITHLEWHQAQLLTRLHGGHVENEKRAFVRACPFNDCKGFLSTAWKCGMCENWTCPECHEVKGAEKDAPHTCDPNNVATAQLLAKDSRNCPKCASMIFKINGCDQMYCTQCHTAFSWKTGRVETGQVHNPHYYEYMRAHGNLPRNPGDVPCGGMPDWALIARFIPRGDRLWGVIANAYRSQGHAQWVMAPRYDVVRLQENRDLRIKFMIGDIDEEEFKKKIQQREKARHRKTEIRQVIDMYSTVLIDVFQGAVVAKNCETLVASLVELKSHFNTTMSQVSQRYTKCAVPKLQDNFEFH